MIKTSAGCQAFTNQTFARQYRQCDYPVKDEIITQNFDSSDVGFFATFASRGKLHTKDKRLYIRAIPPAEQHNETTQ
ncbi:hypothetical protein CLI73_05925 [Porphyromonas gingivalis]|nr:hypothetical protein CLI73_05925 [Porphyromonas gingivalis]